VKTALLVVDAQVDRFGPEAPVHDAPALLARLAGLVTRARAAGAPIVFVRNGGGAGELDEPGRDGWQLHPGLGARPDEDVLVDKGPGDAFPGAVSGPSGGTLDAWLRAAGVTRVVVCGLQSEFSIAATARGALERGYALLLVRDGHSTFVAEGVPAPAAIAATNAEFAGQAEVVPAAEVTFEQV
jgi:streptothricin hydrolase